MEIHSPGDVFKIGVSGGNGEEDIVSLEVVRGSLRRDDDGHSYIAEVRIPAERVAYTVPDMGQK